MPPLLHQAMRYATLNGGKRIRAALVYAAGEALGASTDNLDAAACAVELIHSYSLVHDDLPCMDDDDLRRGQPSCHRAYDDATALLVGDALQSLAFEVLAGCELEPKRRSAMVLELAHASGSQGMAGGQAIDLAAVGQELGLAQLQDMHERKTGALIRVSLQLGALAANADPRQLAALQRYGSAIGLLFQVIDDILDVIADTETLGKIAGADQARNKPTYPSLLGVEAARELAQNLHQDALESLAFLGDNRTTLASIADTIVERVL